MGRIKSLNLSLENKLKNFVKHNWIAFIIIPVVLMGILFIHSTSINIDNAQKEKQSLKLKNVHEEAISKISNSIDNFATLVSGIRSYVEFRDSLPNRKETSEFVEVLLEDLNYKDSIVVSFLDTSHTFIFSFTRSELDPAKLEGKNVKDLRDDKEISELNQIMNDHDLHLFEPINLVEGWQGIPLNFAVIKDKKCHGYVASIINFKYIIQPIYDNEKVSNEFAFHFFVPDGPEFDRERVYNDNYIYNTYEDPEYYQNFDIDTNDFIYSDINKYGLTLRVGAGYKQPPKNTQFSIVAAYTWFLTICTLLFIIFRQLKKTKKINQTLEIANQKIHSKNQSIEESLNFGKSTQAALLTPHTYLSEIFTNYFVLYKPQGTVGGDFYWAHKTADKIFVAVVDCTGHGVSGALMSMVGNRLLNEIVKEKNESDPATILNYMRTSVIEAFEKAEDESISSFGMDMSFCTIDVKLKKLTFAGANSSLLIHANSILSNEIMNNVRARPHSKNLFEIKGDRQGIGKNLRNNQPFTNVSFEINESLNLYLFTDGFEDQFGYENEKRYGKNEFINFIASIQSLEMKNQKNMLDNEFHEWKKNLEQIDDICILGLQLKFK